MIRDIIEARILIKLVEYDKLMSCDKVRGWVELRRSDGRNQLQGTHADSGHLMLLAGARGAGRRVRVGGRRAG